MNYKEKPILKLYKFENSTFIMIAQIDDYQECSFEHNLYQAGTFSVSISFNIPNSKLFERGLFIQFGNNPDDFGEIYSVQDTVGEEGKASQIRVITGYDARYIFKRRVIMNMNSNGLYVMNSKGELCIRNLIKDQCGSGAPSKRRLPIINEIPSYSEAIGKEFSLSEQFTNVYEVCQKIATQSETGWKISFENRKLVLKFYKGIDKTKTVKFTLDMETLSNADFSDSFNNFTNVVYVGGKGQNDDRDIYEGEDVTSSTSPSGLDRFETWDNQSSMTTESEYEAEAFSVLSQYGQTVEVKGKGLVKSIYEFRKNYDLGDVITISFNNKTAKTQILSLTEHWEYNNYDIEFEFGKPVNDLANQLQLILNMIQKASNKDKSTSGVKWYTLPTDNKMNKEDVTNDIIGFVGALNSDMNFTMYLDNEGTGAKTYHVYFKQVTGSGKLTLTTGKSGASNLTLDGGTYVAIIYVDKSGDIVKTI